jgi:hypothetical protein
VFVRFVFLFVIYVVTFRLIDLLCPHLGIANPDYGQSFINRSPAFSHNLFILSPFFC